MEKGMEAQFNCPPIAVIQSDIPQVNGHECIIVAVVGVITNNQSSCEWQFVVGDNTNNGKKSHYDKATKRNHGTSHTHEPYKNTNEAGKTYTGAGNKVHMPTYNEVKNIENGKAKKLD